MCPWPARNQSLPDLPGGVRGLLIVAVLATLAAPAAADIFYLNSGGRVEGQLLATENDQYRIRTAVGIVRLPMSAVAKIEASETPFEEYDRRAAAAAETAEDQFALAQWCEQQGLRAERRKHLQHALDLNPNYASARRALGYVRVGDLWVDGRVTPAHRGTTAEAKETDAERLVREIQQQWYREISSVKRAMLDSGQEKFVQQGRTKVLGIKDPLAILPMTEVLGDGDVNARRLLVEALSAFTADEATMSLAFVGLLDPTEEVRAAAVAELVRRNDPRVVTEYRAALKQGHEIILKRAAWALGQMKAGGGVPDLIDLLKVQRVKWVEVPVKDYFEVWPHDFCWGPRDVGLGAGVVVQIGDPLSYVSNWWARVGYVYFADRVLNEWWQMPVTVYRTEVLEALRKITGKDLGFEIDDWRRWYESQGRRG